MTVYQIGRSCFWQVFGQALRRVYHLYLLSWFGRPTSAPHVRRIVSLVIAGIIATLASKTHAVSIYFSGTGHYYDFVGFDTSQATRTWWDAKAIAESMEFLGVHGYLAVITSQSENDFIVALSLTNAHPSAPGRGGYHIGGYQDPVNRGAAANWKWVTGEAWSISNVVACPDVLWPPDHNLVNVKVGASVSDGCSPVTWKIVRVQSSEPVKGSGDGNTSVDWDITGERTLLLRAERSGNRTGRVYYITIRATDAFDNQQTQTVTVSVPRSRGKAR